MIIRLRNQSECEIDTINHYIRHYPNVEISQNKSFIDDLSKSDCLTFYEAQLYLMAWVSSKLIDAERW